MGKKTLFASSHRVHSHKSNVEMLGKMYVSIWVKDHIAKVTKLDGLGPDLLNVTNFTPP